MDSWGTASQVKQGNFPPFLHVNYGVRLTDTRLLTVDVTQDSRNCVYLYYVLELISIIIHEKFLIYPYNSILALITRRGVHGALLLPGPLRFLSSHQVE